MSAPSSGGGQATSSSADAIVEQRPSLDTSRHVELVMMAHTGRIYLDRTAPGQFVLTDIVTQERARLVGDWSLVIDEGNTDRGVLLKSVGAEDELEAQAVEDVLRKDIGISPSGERFLLTKVDGSVHHQSFDMLMSKMVRASVSIRMLSSAACCDVAVFVMKFRRSCGQLVYWSLVDVYAMLDLSSYNRQASKWIFHCLPGWAKFMLPFLPGSMVVHSKHRNLSDSRLREVPWYDRCLPQTSISTVGLMLLLARWSFAKAERGGLREETPRQVAEQALRSLIGQACSPARCRSFRIEFDKDWVCRWPRPQASSLDDGGSLSFCFVCGGKLCGTSILEVPQPIHLMRLWVSALESVGMKDGVTELDAAAVIQATIGVAALQTVVFQILLQAANQLEGALGDQHLGKTESSSAGFQMELNQVSVSSGHMDEQLFQYALSAQAASERWRVFTVNTDKCSPAGLTLQNSSITFPSGVTVMCPPQVLRVPSATAGT